MWQTWREKREKGGREVIWLISIMEINLEVPQKPNFLVADPPHDNWENRRCEKLFNTPNTIYTNLLEFWNFMHIFFFTCFSSIFCLLPSFLPMWSKNAYFTIHIFLYFPFSSMFPEHFKDYFSIIKFF